MKPEKVITMKLPELEKIEINPKHIRGFYSAYGRMTHIFFQLGNYSGCDDLGSKLQSYKEMFDEFISNCSGLSIYVFVDCKGPNGVKVSYPFGTKNITCVHVPSHLDSCQLESNWMQDGIITNVNGRYLFSWNYSVPAAAVITQYLPGGTREDEVSSIDFKELEIAGGNILTGYEIKAGYDFILGGMRRLPKYPILFGDEFRYFSLYSSKLARYTSLFYHIDLYATLVGPVKDEEEQLLLLAEIQNEPLQFLNPDIRQLYRNKRGRPYLEIDTLPMFVWGKYLDTKKQCFETHLLLSYNNGFVENYLGSSGKRCIVLYLPGYAETLEAYINEIYDETKKVDFKNVFVNSLAAYLKSVSIKPEYLPEKPKKDALIEDARKLVTHVQGFIKKKFEKDEETVEMKVCFLNHNYLRFVQERGALHCLAKVVGRTQLFDV